MEYGARGTSILPRKAVSVMVRVGGRAASLLRGIISNGLLAAFSDRDRFQSYWRQVYGSLIGRPPPLRIPIRTLDAVDPRAATTPISVHDYSYQLGNMPLNELSCVLALARRRQVLRIFEFGTYLGETALQLARNTRADIWTLDLPPSRPREVLDPELDVYPERLGQRFLGSDGASRITQLLGDSRSFDYSSLARSMDLVLVDANHHYEHVLSDSRNALVLVRTGGLVIWHDYANYAPGVVRALDSLSRETRLVHIDGTSLVIHERTE